jgi:diguanylate cyclase (GGDEF)-like protein/PAS domain S-box-containing protein
LLQACALMLLAEMNFSLAASDFDYGNLFANVLLIAALAMVYLGVFQHSIGIPIDAMNKWKAQLKTSQRELNITKLAVDGSDHYIFMYDDATTLLYVSDNACKRLGYKVDELVGKSSAQLSAVASRKMREPDWTSLFEQGHMSYEGTLRTRSGDIIPVDVAITKIVEDDELRYCAIIHDITERKLYEQQRERAADYLRRIIDGIPHFVTVLDAQGNVIDLNEAFAGLYPFDPKTMRGMHYRELIGPFLLDDESRQLMEETLAKALQGISAKCDVYVGGADIHEYIECAFESLVNSEGQIENIIVTGVYITERVRSQIQLKLAATVFDHSAEAILITDGDIRILSVNKAFTIITGFIEEEAINTVPPLFERGKHLEPMRLALLTSGNWSGEVEWLSKSGQLCFEWVTVTEVTGGDGKISNYIVIFSDITEKKRAEEHIQYLAYYDPLTNLPNRVLLEDRIQQAIATAKREDHKVAIIFLDLDHFKTINDSLGHQHGDKILSEVAKRLKRNIREYDTVARLGGDEFIIVLSHLHDSEEAAAISRKLLEELALPYFSGDNELRLTVSIGVSIYPDDGDDFSRLIMNADAAMYHAKESGRNNAQFFIGEMNRRAAELLTVENHLRRAIERNEFILHFQPQIDLRTSAIIGFEALVRWQDPVRGLIPPAQFIPVAEERGLIADIGNWVLREACRQNRAWQDAGLPLIPVAVNISAKQFRNKDFVDNVRRVLLETGLEARYLELEVTETTVMQDAESLISTLEELQQLGVHLAVDDFGTGYSSLSYLKRFPIDKIKIDRSFIRDIPGDKDDHSIVRAIIGLTQQLNLKVIAEGVETIEQLTALRESQCDQYQGFYFSKPVPANDAEQLLRSNRPIG